MSTSPISRPEPESSPQAEIPAVPADASVLRLPTPVRNVGILIIATVASIWMLRWAQSFFVSLLLGILLAYTLNPLVNTLERLKLPRIIATTVVMLGVLFALVFGMYSLRGQVQTIIDQLPAASSKLSAGLESLRRSQERTMQKVQSAARAFEDATKPATVTPPPAATQQPAPPVTPPKAVEPQPQPLNPDADEEASGEADVDAEVNPDTKSAPIIPAPQPLHVVVEQRAASAMGSYLWAGSVGVLGFLGQAAMVIFLIFFLLLSGDTFRRKLVRIAGSSLSSKKITVTILDDINRSIQRYMLMLLTTNVMVGLATWIAFRMIGLDNAGAWAVFAGVAHLIPYFGPAVTAGLTGMAGFIQFGSLSTALLVAGASVLVATLIGTFVTAWMTGRIAKTNTAGVFISLLFFGWLWGVWGLLLSIPIIVIVKVVSQQIEQLHPVAELLGE
jgi:predicted PurR-regulated permease PerM